MSKVLNPVLFCRTRMTTRLLCFGMVRSQLRPFGISVIPLLANLAERFTVRHLFQQEMSVPPNWKLSVKSRLLVMQTLRIGHLMMSRLLPRRLKKRYRSY